MRVNNEARVAVIEDTAWGFLALAAAGRFGRTSWLCLERIGEAMATACLPIWVVRPAKGTFGNWAWILRITDPAGDNNRSGTWNCSQSEVCDLSANTGALHPHLGGAPLPSTKARNHPALDPRRASITIAPARSTATPGRIRSMQIAAIMIVVCSRLPRSMSIWLVDLQALW